MSNMSPPAWPWPSGCWDAGRVKLTHGATICPKFGFNSFKTHGFERSKSCFSDIGGKLDFLINLNIILNMCFSKKDSPKCTLEELFYSLFWKKHQKRWETRSHGSTPPCISLSFSLHDRARTGKKRERVKKRARKSTFLASYPRA